MANEIIRIFSNERLIKGAHWTMFSVGLLSLTFAIGATAASYL